ncbi:hypothetical protein ANCDUO_01209 [Ancylostoma duodenale]|uniref:Protein kinase domain-containing protein n=1 Tax=Ancylostoma duodenale TaxID=51022 RepID=A0A0C2DZJ0_9BILA|nr:hypothetical protein ANCDUO_01209 [Ancylostoma duodenale]
MPEIVVSVLNDKKELVNLTINSKQDHKLPGHAKLKHGISRPVWLIKHENVVFDKDKDLLGRGNFCNVYKGIYNRPPDEKIVVAVKICHEGSASRGFQETKEARDQMLSEAQMMSYYVHSHVIEVAYFFASAVHVPVLPLIFG